jgi:hypothetical protein
VVRVQAATAVARIENAFLAKAMELEAAVREKPDEASVLRLAGIYDDYAFAGLLDKAREEECRQKAADGYRAYLRTRPDDQAVQLRLARLQLRRGRMEEAEPLLRRLATVEGHSGAGLWLMECLFTQGRFAELRSLAVRVPHGAAEELPPLAPAAIEMWTARERIA